MAKLKWDVRALELAANGLSLVDIHSVAQHDLAVVGLGIFDLGIFLNVPLFGVLPTIHSFGGLAPRPQEERFLRRNGAILVLFLHSRPQSDNNRSRVVNHFPYIAKRIRPGTIPDNISDNDIDDHIQHNPPSGQTYVVQAPARRVAKPIQHSGKIKKQHTYKHQDRNRQIHRQRRLDC